MSTQDIGDGSGEEYTSSFTDTTLLTKLTITPILTASTYSNHCI